MLRNVKSRVDTSSPRSCARLGSPAMSQSEKTFKKNTAQDIKRRFKNVLHFPKRNKNSSSPTSPSVNAQTEEASEVACMETNPCASPNQTVPRPTTRRHPNQTPTVQPFTIRSYVPEPPKNPRTCHHTCLHHKHSVSKNFAEKRSSQTEQCQHKCVVHTPQLCSKNKMHLSEQTGTVAIYEAYKEDYSKNKTIESKEYHHQPSKVYIEQIDSRHKNNLSKNLIHMEPSGDAEKSRTHVQHNDDFYLNMEGNEDSVYKLPNQKRKEYRTEKYGHIDSEDVHETVNSSVTKSYTQRSTEEHEYLMFLLRVTEDIIVNNFYSNEDIKTIFERHIEENKQSLEYEKMLYQISNLCKELDINCKEYSDFQIKKPFGSPRESKCIFDRSIFKNCKRCSNLPLTPKFFGNDNVSKDGSMNMKISEKFSLGRVTECTEPKASTSTLNTPKIIEILQAARPDLNELMSRRLEFIDKEFICDKGDDKYFKEHRVMEEKEDDSSTSIPPISHNPIQRNLVIQNFQINTVDSIENQNMDFYINLDFQDNTTSQESEDSFKVSSKKSKNEFAKFSLDEVWSNTKHLINQLNFEQTNNQRAGFIENKKKVDVEKNIENIKPLTIDYLSEDLKENTTQHLIGGEQNTLQLHTPQTIENQEYDGSIFLKNEYEQISYIEKNISTILKELTAKTKKECAENNEVIDIFRNSTQKIVEVSTNSDSSKSNCENLISSAETVKNDAKLLVTSQQHVDNGSDNRECIIKVSVEGNLKESDYIYLKGPVYVLKALLNVQPELIIVQEEIKNENDTGRHDSMDSVESNKTYIVTSHIATEEFDINVVEQLDMIDIKDTTSITNIHDSVDSLQKQFNKKVEFLKKPSETYNIAYSDYDLTPEKEYTGKYHNLLVDAATSVTHISPKMQVKEIYRSGLDQVHEKTETTVPISENAIKMAPQEMAEITENTENPILEEGIVTHDDEDKTIIASKNHSDLLLVAEELNDKEGQNITPQNYDEILIKKKTSNNLFLIEKESSHMFDEDIYIHQNDSKQHVDINRSTSLFLTEKQHPKCKEDLTKFENSEISIEKNSSIVFDTVLNDIKLRFGGLDKSLTINVINSDPNLKTLSDKKSMVQSTDSPQFAKETNVSDVNLPTLSNSTITTKSNSSSMLDFFTEKLVTDKLIEPNIINNNDSVLDVSEYLEHTGLNSDDDDHLSKTNKSVGNLVFVKANNLNVHEMDQGDVKDNGIRLKNTKESIHKINQELESEIKGNDEIMSFLESEVTPIKNDQNAKGKLKLSRSEISASKLFRNRTGIKKSRNKLKVQIPLKIPVPFSDSKI